MPYWEEPKYNEPEEVDEPEDVALPTTLHHMQAQAELNVLVREGALTDREAEAALEHWRARQDVSEEARLVAAVDELEERGLLGGDRADGIRESIAG